MSKRGNPDYFKTAGHAAEDPDVGEQAKRRFSEQRPVSIRGATRWLRPERPIKAAGVHDGDLPWRVTHRQAPRPNFQVVPGEGQPATLPRRVVRFALRAVLSPAHVALSIADALVERALWRLEREA